MKYYVVDAFAEKLFEGKAAGHHAISSMNRNILGEGADSAFSGLAVDSSPTLNFFTLSPPG